MTLLVSQLCSVYGKVTGTMTNWKGFQRKGLWPKKMFPPTYTFKGKQMNKIQDTRFAARVSIWTPLGYKPKTFRNVFPRKQVQAGKDYSMHVTLRYVTFGSVRLA